MIFLKRNRELLQKIDEYINTSSDILQYFKSSIINYMKNNDMVDFELQVKKIKKLESNVDEQLHDIEEFLYKKSLLPDLREDILKLLEELDDIVDYADHIMRYVFIRKIKIPENLIGQTINMLNSTCDCCNGVKNAINDLFKKRQHIKKFVNEINDYESICDEIQTEMITTIYSDDNIVDFDKILLDKFVDLISSISDSCENVADIITIINVKSVV